MSDIDQVGETRPRAQVVTCPWSLRAMLPEIGDEHEQVEAIHVVPQQSGGDAFWHFGLTPAMDLFIRIRGRFCPRVIEGQTLMQEYITEYLARRTTLLERDRQTRNTFERYVKRTGPCDV